MLWSVLVCALVCLCVYMWCVVRGERRGERRGGWSAWGVPELPADWLRGSCDFLLKENPAHWFIRKQREFPGAPLVGMTLPLRRPALLVCSPEAAAEALKPGVCKERLLASGSHDPAGSLNIFTVKDPLWSLLRRQVSPMLTAGRVRAAAGLVRDRAGRLTKRIDRELAKGEAYDLKEILTDFTTDIISVAVLGVESNALMEEESIAREVTREFRKYNLLRGLTWSSIFFCPQFLKFLRTPMFPKQAVKLIEFALKSGVETKLVDEKEKKKMRGVKDIQLPDEYKDIRETAILAQAVILIQGGFDTTSAAITFSLIELAHDKEAQEKLYRELYSAKERVNGELDSATLAELPYFNAVLKETLRLYPIMSWIDRMTSQPVELAGVPVSAGTPLFINIAGMQRDPLYFPDPDRFNPERFLPENEHNIKPYSYIPFGDGPKACVGRRFGEQNYQFGVSEIILKYALSPGAGCPLPKDYLWEKKSILLLPGEPLQLNFTPRETTK